jgi:polyferredoxin/NAD-dependent dihydropyrimidine dehydrogenase PreA subunit
VKARQWRRLKALRIFSQILFGAAFLIIYLRSLDPFSSADNFFLRFDPLILLTQRRLFAGLVIPALLVLLLTFVLGRFFCGWMCPLGGLIDILDALRARLRYPRRHRPPRLRITVPVSLFILGLALVSAFLPLPLLQFLHPHVWMVRLLSVSLPGLLFLVFLLFLALHSPRFWCRHLCPLGTLYGLAASVSLLGLRIEGCSHCGGCDRCPMAAVPEGEEYVARRLCILCFAFEHRCPRGSFRYGTERRMLQGFSASRRRFLESLASLIGGAALGGLPALAAPVPATGLLRPPGVVLEAEFLKRCLRCLQCLRSCPNAIIKAAGIKGGLDGLLTPRLDFSRQGCDYNCQVCQLVCPNEAIPRQALREKQATAVGLAVIDQSICVVYSRGLPCIVCEELCPVPEKAIRLRREGELEYPLVTPDCIGCGMCEAHCPTEPRAIRVIGFPNLGSLGKEA